MLSKKRFIQIILCITFFVIMNFLDDITNYYKSINIYLGFLLMKIVYIIIIAGFFNIIMILKEAYKNINKKLFCSAILILFLSQVNAYEFYINLPDMYFNKTAVSTVLTSGAWKTDALNLSGYDWYVSRQGNIGTSYLINDSTLGKITGVTGAGTNGFLFAIIDFNGTVSYNTDTSSLHLGCDIPGINYNFLVAFLDEDYNCLFCYDYQNQNPNSCHILSGSPCAVTSGRLGTDKCSTTYAIIDTKPRINTTFRYLVIGGAGAGITINNYFDNINLSEISYVPYSEPVIDIYETGEYIHNIIEDNLLGVTNFDLVDISKGFDDTESIMPRIFYYSFRQGFLIFTVFSILLTIIVLCCVIALVSIITTFINNLNVK